MCPSVRQRNSLMATATAIAWFRATPPDAARGHDSRRHLAFKDGCYNYYIEENSRSVSTRYLAADLERLA